MLPVSGLGRAGGRSGSGARPGPTAVAPAAAACARPHSHKQRRGPAAPRIAQIDPPSTDKDASTAAADAAAPKALPGFPRAAAGAAGAAQAAGPSQQRAQRAPAQQQQQPADPLASLLETLMAPAAAAANVAAAAAAAFTVPSSSGRRPPRPLIPQVDLPSVLATMLGEDSQSDTIGDNLVTDNGPPRLFTPYLRGDEAAAAARGAAGPRDPSALPLMFYLPGIDGTGLAAFKQFPRLMPHFDLRCLIVPPGDRSTYETLLDTVGETLRAQIEADGKGRPVYLMGESFGGLLALGLAERLGALVDRLVLVNPATSFKDSVWPQVGPLLPQVPRELYRLLPFGLAPVLSDPLAMARHAVDESGPLLTQASDYLYGLLELMPQLSALQRVLPPETLAWRLELLRQGCTHLTPARLKAVKQRTLVVAGERDLLIPSAEEAEKLVKALPRARKVVLQGRSHAVLQEAGIDLVQIMQSQGFYVTERRLSNGRRSTSATDGGGVAFATTAPLQLPTPTEVKLDADGLVSTIRRLCSPVYYSTLPGGRVVRGFDGVPRRGPGGSGAPILFIGNHQLGAFDMYVMIPDMLEATGILPRGLAHPIVFQGTLPPPEGEDGAAPSTAGSGGDNGGSNFGSLLATYGAVPVSAFAMHRLLGAGENVLLYPGGAREAFKRKGENYKLIWPERAEFVRLAAKFGATIVPFSAIGADEAFTQILDISEIKAIQDRLPWTAADAAKEASRIPRARVGVNATMEDTESFGLPLVAPAVPRRFYFLFGEPIPTDKALASDRDRCNAIYSDVKAAVEGGMGYLLRRRETDPYGDFAARAIYEASWNGERQAPSFEP